MLTKSDTSCSTRSRWVTTQIDLTKVRPKVPPELPYRLKFARIMFRDRNVIGHIHIPQTHHSRRGITHCSVILLYINSQGFSQYSSVLDTTSTCSLTADEIAVSSTNSDLFFAPLHVMRIHAAQVIIRSTDIQMVGVAGFVHPR